MPPQTHHGLIGVDSLLEKCVAHLTQNMMGQHCVGKKDYCGLMEVFEILFYLMMSFLSVWSAFGWSNGVGQDVSCIEYRENDGVRSKDLRSCVSFTAVFGRGPSC